MIKFLKKLWKKCFNRVGDSRIKTEVIAVKNTPTSIPVLIVEPKPQPVSLHCATHTRFKKVVQRVRGLLSNGWIYTLSIRS